MGFGLPAAIGAKVARPDKLVVNIDGDGCFMMNIQELATAKIEKINARLLSSTTSTSAWWFNGRIPLRKCSWPDHSL